MCRRAAQGVRGSFSAKLHAGGVYHEARFQFSARRDRRSAYWNLADVITFLLDFRAALSPNCSRHSAPKLQIIVRSIHDGVHVHLGQVALDNFNPIGKIHLQEDPSRTIVTLKTAELFLCHFFSVIIHAAT
jgi:hypothetical protein